MHLHCLPHKYKTSNALFDKTVIRSKLTILLSAWLTTGLLCEVLPSSKAKHLMRSQTSEKGIQCHLETPNAVHKCDRGVQCHLVSNRDLRPTSRASPRQVSRPKAYQDRPVAERVPRRPAWNDCTHVDTIKWPHRGTRTVTRKASQEKQTTGVKFSRFQSRHLQAKPSPLPTENDKRTIKSKALELLDRHHPEPICHSAHSRQHHLAKHHLQEQNTEPDSSISENCSEIHEQSFTAAPSPEVCWCRLEWFKVCGNLDGAR